MFGTCHHTKAGKRGQRFCPGVHTDHVSSLLLLLTAMTHPPSKSLLLLDTVLRMNTHLLHEEIKQLARETTDRRYGTDSPQKACFLPPLNLETRQNSPSEIEIGKLGPWDGVQRVPTWGESSLCFCDTRACRAETWPRERRVGRRVVRVTMPRESVSCPFTDPLLGSEGQGGDSFVGTPAKSSQPLTYFPVPHQPDR